MSDELRIPRADADPQETREWLDSLEYVLQRNGETLLEAAELFHGQAIPLYKAKR